MHTTFSRSSLAARSARQTLSQRMLSSFISGKDGKYFDKILVANRGEIACRVMRTAKRLGIKTVAIYSDPDIGGEHVKMADEAYNVGPAASALSYLNVKRIMEVIEMTGVQAVHPGYGFLSENSIFSAALAEHNIEFIGPGAHAIEAMGDKIESKEFARKANVNTVPGCLDVITDGEHAVKIANQVGYPVMIKATAGGGGKGMRIAWNDKEAKMGFRLSTEEARSSFGDDRIFIEKFIEEPRHIEIQLVADKHGNVLCLPERECSIQRRNQKVLEESPSPFLDPETRKAMQDQAAALAKAVNYHSAGTVEFLCDKDKNFYFLEMNTRLQVEHPVSELVSKLDLVELMLHVAAGHPIPAELLEKPLPIYGWAHEARVYAEDPFRGFLPSIGRLIDYREPTSEQVFGKATKEGDMNHLRIDSGVVQGSEISMYYDPMISKTITHGPTREAALDSLSEAIDRYVVRGVGHNLNFIRDVTRHARFRSGNITTKFIEEEYPEGFTGVVLKSEEKAMLAVLATIGAHSRKEASQLLLNGAVPEAHTPFPSELKVNVDGDLYDVSNSHDDEVGFVFHIANQQGEKYHIAPMGDLELDMMYVAVALDVAKEGSGKKLSSAGEEGTLAQVAQIIKPTPLGFEMQFKGALCQVDVMTPREYELSKHMLEKKAPDFSKMLISPMPGALVSLNVKEGDHVVVGQEICVMEAMKMQNVLTAEMTGYVKKVYHKPGATLAVDEVIVEFTDEKEE